MNQKDITEIKRRLNPKYGNPTIIQGCYLTAEGTVISRFATPIGMLS